MSLPSIGRRLSLVVMRAPTGGLQDDWGNPTRTFADVAAFLGDVQPTRTREALQANDAGPSIVDHVVLADATVALYAGDLVRRDPDDGRRWRLMGPGRRIGEGLRLDHVEADAQVVVGPVP